MITGCVSTRQRYHGEGNNEVTLGATEDAFASRFSQVAAELMRFDVKLSVEVSQLSRGGRGVDH